ncbi:hypothetical protein EDD85DRAFT_951218 [Armillaria nabsnona]|nr:hypothetical protein EDD85DRAFT_951218 [Armillaria nabsnona]
MARGKKRRGKAYDAVSQTSTAVITAAKIAAVDFNLGVPDSFDNEDETWDEKNWWTNPEQTMMLMRMRYPRREYAAMGQLATFNAAFHGRWRRRYPELPENGGGFLDLGPDHCLDDCELVVDLELPEMQRIGKELDILANGREIQLYHWFYNQPIGKKRKSKIKLTYKGGRVPRAIHVYSRLYYQERIAPMTALEAEKLGLPRNDLKLVREVTARAWENETKEIKEHVSQLLEHERETVAAWKDGTLDMASLSSEEIDEIIGSLAYDFEDIFEEFYKRTGWGVTIIAGGADPYTGVVRTAGYSFGCKLPNGKDFIAAFNDAAASGYIPGAAAGDTRPFSEYYGRPFWYHMKNVIMSRDARSESPDPAADAETEMSANVSTLVPPLPVDQNLALSAPGPQPTANPTSSLLVSTPINPERHRSQSSSAPTSPPDGPEPSTSLPQTIFNGGSQILGGADQSMPFSGDPMENVSFRVTETDRDLPLAISGLPGSYGISSDPLTSNSSVNDIFNLGFDAESWLQGFQTEQDLSLEDFPWDLFNVPSSVPSGSASGRLGWPSSVSTSTLIPVGPGSIDNAVTSSISEQDWTSGDFAQEPSNVVSSALHPSHSGGLGWLSSITAQISVGSQSINNAPVNTPASISDVSTGANLPAPANSTISVFSTTTSAPGPNGSATADTATATEAIKTNAIATFASAGADAPGLQLPNIVNIVRQPRLRKAPAPKEVVTLSEREHGPPEWLNDNFEAMQDALLGSSWLSLLTNWHGLELANWEDSAMMGKLPIKQRPRALSVWLDGVRSFEAGPIISESSAYAAEMVEWWVQVNPAWRRSTDGFLIPDYSKPITTIRRGGRQGLVTLVFGLYWWGRLCRESGLWSQTVDDVTKAIGTLITSSKPLKRPNNSGHHGSAKRMRI